MAPQDKKTVEEMADIVADELGLKAEDLGLNDLCNYHVPLLNVFNAMTDYAAQQVTADRERIIGLVEQDYRKWAIQGSWLAREVSDALQSLKHKLLNSK